MKKLFFGISILISSIILITACNKQDGTTNQNIESKVEKDSHFGTITYKKPPGIRIFTVELHRPAGKFNNQGQDCNCALCGGFCDFVWFPDFKKSANNGNHTFGLEYLTDNTARIYFFDDVDVDDIDDPIFYIDEDVTIHEGDEETVSIPKGQFNLIYSSGLVSLSDGDYTYNSYIDVPYTNN